MVTQRQIAQSVGVSVMTVSKALRGAKDISEPLRLSIALKAREMGYDLSASIGSKLSKLKTESNQPKPTQEPVDYFNPYAPSHF